MSKGGGTTTQTQTNEPAEFQKPYLEGLLSRANRDYTNRDLAQVAGQSDYTMQAQEGIADRAGMPQLSDSASDLAYSTLQGDYLNGESNPYLQDQIRRSQQTTIDNFNEQVAPGIDSTFSGAGRLGSGAYAAQRNRAEDTLTDSLSDTAGQLAYQNYGDERQRQIQTMGAAPGLDQAGYYGLDRLAGVGGQQDAYAQAQADLPYNNISRYANLVYGSPSFGTSTSTGQEDSGSDFATYAGLGLSAAGLFMSDERVKENIKQVGKLDNGNGVYVWNYIGDDTKHTGFMAQELEKTNPDVVHEVEGIKMVDYGALAEEMS